MNSVMAAGSACALVGLRMKDGCLGVKATHFHSSLPTKAVLRFLGLWQAGRFCRAGAQGWQGKALRQRWQFANRNGTPQSAAAPQLPQGGLCNCSCLCRSRAGGENPGLGAKLAACEGGGGRTGLPSATIAIYSGCGPLCLLPSWLCQVTEAQVVLLRKTVPRVGVDAMCKQVRALLWLLMKQE